MSRWGAVTISVVIVMLSALPVHAGTIAVSLGQGATATMQTTPEQDAALRRADGERPPGSWLMDQIRMHTANSVKREAARIAMESCDAFRQLDVETQRGVIAKRGASPCDRKGKK